MPWKRNYKKKGKKAYKKRTSRFGKNAYPERGSVNIQNQASWLTKPFYCTRWGSTSVIATAEWDSDFDSSSWCSTYSDVWKLTDVANASEFTNLFDQYKILGVEIIFQLGCTTTNDPTGTANVPGCQVCGELLCYEQRYNSSAPTSLTDMFQRGNLQRMSFKDDGRLSVYIRKPTIHAAAADLSDMIVPAGVEMKSPWINTSGTSSNVTHFGLDWVIRLNIASTISNSFLPQLTVTRKFYLAFRGIT